MIARILLLALLTLAFSACASQTNRIAKSRVPPKALAVLEKYTHDGVYRKVSTDDNDSFYYNVEYVKSNLFHELMVDEEGHVIKVGIELTPTQIPGPVQMVVFREGGPMARLGPVMKESHKGRNFYYVEFEKDGFMRDVAVSEDGKTVSRTCSKCGCSNTLLPEPKSDSFKSIKEGRPE